VSIRFSVASVLASVLGASLLCAHPAHVFAADGKGARMVRVAGLVIPKLPGEKEKNYAEFDRLARDAAKQGAQIICTPEGFLEGYIVQTATMETYRALCEEIPDGPYVKKMRDLARELKVYIVAGLAEKDAGRQYNSAIIISPDGRIVARHRKVHNADDEPHNTTGTEFSAFDTSLARVGMMICYDRQMPESARLLAVKGAQIILTPSSGMFGGINDTLMVTRAYENSVYVVFVHPQDCLIINPNGEIMARYNGDSRMIMADLELSLVGHGPITGRKGKLYKDLAK
jgi:predicted amidohydrolase